MSTITAELQKIRLELTKDGPHAGEGTIKRAIHVLRAAGVASIDALGKLDDQNRESDLRSLAVEFEALTRDLVKLLDRPGLSLVMRFFGSGAIESTLTALAAHTGDIDDWMRTFVQPVIHELRETFVELDDELTESFPPVAV